MFEILIKDQDKMIKYDIGKSLLDILLENDVFVDNPCNGRGSCGKCKVKILKGELPSITEVELKLLKEQEIKENIRLSCLIEPKENLVIEILQKERKNKVLTTGYMPTFGFKSLVHKKVVIIEKSTLENVYSLEASICKAFDVKELDYNIFKDSTDLYGTITGVFYYGKLICIEKEDTKDSLYGVSIDIGTTTVIASLINMNTGEEISVSSMVNPQKKFGLDVLTRITYQLENKEESKQELQSEIINAINNMIEEMCNKCSINKSNIYEIVVSANCTMIHFLLGIEAISIGKSPYTPIILDSKNIPAKEVGIIANQASRVYCLPSVSSYIGADIVAGIYVSELHKSKEKILFIDIGTNGEIVLSNQGKLVACSCAAGPALEGMNISSGMRASDGAIEDIKITENGIEIKVIGDEEPVGICGSGILAAVKELIRIGVVKKSGVFIKKEDLDKDDYRYDMIQLNGKKREFILHNHKEPILITQGDIRQVQLAKGAILSGFYALLRHENIEMNQLDKIIIAGQFGAHLPTDSLTGVGILPKEVEGKLTYVGNSSKIGAYMALMSSQVKQEIEKIAKEVKYIELNTIEGYERLFTDCTLFK